MEHWPSSNPIQGNKIFFADWNILADFSVLEFNPILALYRRVGDDKGRTHELEQSAVKCMRGLLFCYMRQAEKVSDCYPRPRHSIS